MYCSVADYHAIDTAVAYDIVLDLQSGGCRFKSWPGLLRIKVHSAFHPSGVDKRVTAIAGMQRHVWLISIADGRAGVQVKL